MWSSILQAFNITLIGLAIIGIIKFPSAKLPIRVIIIYIIVTALSENIAFYTAVKYEYNLIVYHIYGPIQIFLLSLFYNNIIKTFKKNNAGIIIGIIGVIASILNSLFLQPPKDFLNTNFLVFESIVIIGLSLYYFYDYLKQEINKKDIIPNEFYIACLLLVFSSFTLLYWSIQPLTADFLKKYNMLLNYILIAINTITYLGIGFLLLKNKGTRSE